MNRFKYFLLVALLSPGCIAASMRGYELWRKGAPEPIPQIRPSGTMARTLLMPEHTPET